MSRLRTLPRRGLPIPFLLTLAVLAGALLVEGKEPPADACGMLPATQVAKVLGQPFGSPAKTTAPAAFLDSVTGTDCTYRSGGGRQLLFRIYFDPSVAVAKDTFARLSMFFGPNKTVAGDWDSAYLDSKHAIHVQKGKARYYLGLSPIGTDATQAEKQLKDLATWVAAQL